MILFSDTDALDLRRRVEVQGQTITRDTEGIERPGERVRERERERERGENTSVSEWVRE